MLRLFSRSLKTLFSGIQQIGIGVPNVKEAFRWYSKHLSMNIPVFEEAATADLMLPYTGGKPHDRHAILALNMQGGGGFEIWQYTSRTPQAANFEIQLGDLGIYACKLKSADVDAAFSAYPKELLLSKQVEQGPDRNKHFYAKDPYGNVFDIVEDATRFRATKAKNGGVFGAVIGVRDLEKSIAFYANVLEYDKTLYKGEDSYSDLQPLPNGNTKVKRAILAQSEERLGAFSPLLGPSQIELVELTEGNGRKMYQDRYWGDLGYIHLCFDTIDMESFQERTNSAGHPFTVDSANSFDMGAAAGRFAYIEDPDGTLIEFVETHKVPIMKKWGIYLNLKRRNKQKPLPRWMLNSLSLNKKKD